MTEAQQQATPPSRLVCLDPGGLRTASGRVVELNADAVTLGRSPENTVTIDGEGVSRVHARVYPEAGRWGIRDVGSRNGILVNNTSTREAWLHHGDIVMLGKLAYRFIDDAEDERQRMSDSGTLDITGVGEKTIVLNDAQGAIEALLDAQEPEHAASHTVDVGDSGARTLSMHSVDDKAHHEQTVISDRKRQELHRHANGSGMSQFGPGVWMILIGLVLFLLVLAGFILKF